MGSEAAQQKVYELLTGEDDGRVCRDIPDEACREQPRNFVKHVISLAATKSGDGLVDPKLVLSWLLASLGAPAYLIGLLVPLREAGALLPQLFVAGFVRSQPLRKWVWAIGSLLQGAAVAGMALAALQLDGAAAGWTIIALLAVFAVARSFCSISYKDVLGKTVSKATRGTATGTASSLAAAFVLIFGLLLSFGLLEKSVVTIALVMAVAAVLWLLAAGLFATLQEEAGATEGGGNPIAVVLRQFSLLKEDRQLVRFIVVRGLLIATALAPPFILALAGQSGDGSLGELGTFVVASAVAAVLSSYIWGRLADVSSRDVLTLSALVGALVLAATAIVALVLPGLLQSFAVLPGLLFVLMVAYQGVRLGRSTHLVDMATEETRAAYTALSNTMVGALLLAGSLFGVLAHLAGTVAVIALFSVMCAVAAVVARGLDPVQDNEA